MGVIYKLHKDEPNNPDVLILGGAGSLSLNALKLRVARRLISLAEMSEEADSLMSWKNILSKTESNIFKRSKNHRGGSNRIREITGRWWTKK